MVAANYNPRIAQGWNAVPRPTFYPDLVTPSLWSLTAPSGATRLWGMSSAETHTDESLLAAITAAPRSKEARQAAQRLYEAHGPSLLAFLLARTHRTEAEDIHQMVWEKLWLKPPTTLAGGSLRGWVFQVARNLLIDTRRKKKPGEMPEDFDHADATSDFVQELRQAEEITRLRECVQSLNDTLAVVVRGILAGLGYNEICDQHGLKPNEAHQRFHRAKESLRKCVEGSR